MDRCLGEPAAWGTVSRQLTWADRRHDADVDCQQVRFAVAEGVDDDAVAIRELLGIHFGAILSDDGLLVDLDR